MSTSSIGTLNYIQLHLEGNPAISGDLVCPLFSDDEVGSLTQGAGIGTDSSALSWVNAFNAQIIQHRAKQRIITFEQAQEKYNKSMSLLEFVITKIPHDFEEHNLSNSTESLEFCKNLYYFEELLKHFSISSFTNEFNNLNNSFNKFICSLIIKNKFSLENLKTFMKSKGNDENFSDEEFRSDAFKFIKNHLPSS